MNLLVVGSSISAIDCCGIKDAEGKVWHSLIPNTNVTNLSSGGQSNTKIFNKTTIEVIKNPKKYDLIAVQWTSLIRLSMNRGQTIYDNQVDFTLGSRNKDFKRFQKIWENNFCHPRIELLEWLAQITALTAFLSAQGQNFIFITTYDNFLPNLIHSDWHDCDKEFLDIVLNLPAMIDEEITPYYRELYTCYQSMVRISESNWLNLYTPPWLESAVDRAEDNEHPGVDSHKLYAEDFIKKIELIF